jgi:transcriptional regulator with XRE-family HTH domain
MEPEQVFAAVLRASREQQGLSQSTLAEKVGLDPTAITKIEKGNRSIRLNLAVAISHVLGKSLADMLNEETVLMAERQRLLDQLASIDAQLTKEQR